MKHITFNKKRLAVAMSMLLGAGMSFPGHAQEAEAAADDDVEVISVKGIRGSLMRAMDMKREGTGVVDAISAEEMGKFPDTNLAESLQRITGITVSRSNGEGSEITARGFGPAFNLVTLNGRQMPGTGNTRSYDLSNLSSEGVSALEVIKTARAENPSGGIGALVNIITAKPLNSPGLKYSVSAKGIYDTSNVKGDDVTPELAALYSNTFADNKFGVALSLSLQERDFQQQSANVPGWQADQGLGNGFGIDLRPNASITAEQLAANKAARAAATAAGDPLPDLLAPSADDIFDGSVADGKTGHTYFPRQISYNINDFQRSKINGQLTLQYAPTEDMTATLDYVRSEAETAAEGLGFGIWFNFGGNINSYELDENGTAIRFNESSNDYAHSANVATTLVEAESIGFNFEWQLNDDIHLEFDYHDSTNAIDNGKDTGSGHSGNVILAPNNIDNKTYDYSTGEVPNFEIFWPNGAAEAAPGDFDPLFAQIGRSAGESAIKQFQFDSEWLNPDDNFLVNVKFGMAHTEQVIGGFGADNGNQGPNGYNGNQAIFPDSMFTRQDTGDFLDQLDGGGSDLTTNYYYTFDYAEVIARMAANFDPFFTDPFATGGIDSFSEVEESTGSAYVQAALYFEIADMPVDVNLGVRYEQTEVISSVQQQVEDFIVWSNPTEWQLIFEEGSAGIVVGVSDYDLTLPNIDIKMEITEDIVGRFSAGKTITRPNLGLLAGTRSLSGSPKPGSRTGASGNTSLLPFESTNLDFSFEYYYAEASYVSLGYFQKSVKNFISTTISTITVDGLRDPLNGPRAAAAIQDLRDAAGDQGLIPEDGEVWTQILANGGGVSLVGYQNDVVVQNSDDPLLEWDVSRPSNGDTKDVDGIEFAVQHMFGESGFGASFNATIVDGDVEFDVESFEQQAPLNGLSDSANFQAFYEKDGLSVKVTYAWRDDYLIGVGQAQGSSEAPPQFGKEYAQTDISVNYDVNEELTVFFEGLNITNETEQGFGRYEEQFLFARQYGPRYTLGARYTF
ncbi:MAG: iron complex outermembrane receptor protein [Paraglaciecola sp.]|jgi:iron complex outermembrane receptor protein